MGSGEPTHQPAITDGPALSLSLTAALTLDWTSLFPDLLDVFSSLSACFSSEDSAWQHHEHTGLSVMPSFVQGYIQFFHFLEERLRKQLVLGKKGRHLAGLTLTFLDLLLFLFFSNSYFPDNTTEISPDMLVSGRKAAAETSNIIKLHANSEEWDPQMKQAAGEKQSAPQIMNKMRNELTAGTKTALYLWGALTNLWTIEGREEQGQPLYQQHTPQKSLSIRFSKKKRR